MTIKLSAIGIVLCACLQVLFSCRGKQENEEWIRPVKYKQVSKSAGEKQRTFSGISMPASETELSFRVGGVISQVNASVGDSVERGEVIARIDNIDDQLELEQSRSILQDMEAQLQTAEASLRRVRRLFESNSVSLRDYEQAKSEYANARSNYETARKTVDLKRRQVSYGVLKAPVSGIVIDSKVQENEAINPGDVVMILSGGDSIAVEVGVPENFVGRIKKSQRVTISFASFPGRDYPGFVSLVPYGRQYESAAYKVDIQVDTIDPDLRPGMTARVTFLLEEMSQDQLLIPSESVSQDIEGTFVYVIDTLDDNTGVVHRKTIMVGELTSEGYEVISGLSGGELIVTAGIEELSDGKQVKLLSTEL